MVTATARRVQLKGTRQALANCALDSRIIQYVSGGTFRGVAYVWVKTNRQGHIIAGQGVPPTFTKPTTELLLAATTIPTGRPFPILDLAQAQVVLEPRGSHSEKPHVFRERIEQLCGDRPRIELFARTRVAGWDAWGAEL